MNKLVKLDPITGPIPREKFAELVEKPFGEALKIIRKYDPSWGREPGEKFDWVIECKCSMYGRAIVKAADQKEADALADNLSHCEVDWGDDADDFEIISVEPAKCGVIP